MINKKINITGILIFSLMVSGCELIGPKLHEKMPLERVHQIDPSEQSDVFYQELSNETAGEKGEDKPKIELYPGSGQVMSHRAGGRNKPAKQSGKGEYSLNFDDADLGEVAKVILSDILGENYVLSPKVSGKVTLQTTQPLSRAELMPTLEMLLQLNNAGMTYQDGLYQIKSKAEAVTGSALTSYNNYRQKVPAGYQIRVIPVRNVAVDELAEIIKPIIQDKTILHVDSSRNMMLVAGNANELKRIMELVNTFDVDMMKGRSFGLFPIQNVEAATMIEELEQVFNNKAKGAESSFFRFMEIERLNAILAITHQAKYLRQIESWVIRLDRANTSAAGGVMVYRAQHVDALELADTLNEIFGQGGSQKKSASVASGKKAIEVTNKNRKEKTPPKTPKTTRRNQKSPSLSDVGEISIIADEINNALIIVATAQDYAVVMRVIKELDVMPLQVLIDATIVEVTLTDNLEYGIKWFLSHNNNGDTTANNAASSGGGFNLSNVAADVASDLAIGAATGGFGYAFASNSGDIKAVLNAAATDGNVNVISSPSLMVLNNQEASIQVGDEVPIRTSESTNTSGGANPIQTSSIQQRKTGVKLNVQPRVNANGLVIMEIEQSVENVVQRPASGSGAAGSDIDSPTISTREISSSVAVQSGETVVLGGLIQNSDTFNKGGIPLLHELPLIGPLFGTTTKNNAKTELVVLITPRVVKTRQDARLITNEFQRKLSGIYQESAEIEVVDEMKALEVE